MKKIRVRQNLLRAICLLPALFLGCSEGRNLPTAGSDVRSVAPSQFEASGQLKDPVASSQVSQRKDVIVQLFNWPFRMIQEEIPLLAELGYGQIHVSPPNLTIDSDQWWGRYQPVDYRAIAGPLGNEKDFKEMIDTAHQHGMRILIDIVLNHTANDAFPMPEAGRKLAEELGPLFYPEDYHPAVCISDYNNPFEVRRNRLCGAPGDRGLPDLDQNSPNVLRVQKAFIDKLISLGVDGFRIDAMKHMDPDYFHRLFTPEQRRRYFFFGEIITDSQNFDRDLSPYLNATSFSFYDFPLRATIQRAFGFGGYLGELLATNLVETKRAVPWDRSVTFVMAHDIPNNDVFRSMILDPTDELLAYGYLLGRSEGVPYVYSDLGKSYGAGLRDERWAFAHRSPILSKMIQFHNRVQGSLQQNLVANACVIVFSRDQKGLVAINKCTEMADINVDPRWDSVSSVYDVFSGNPVGFNAFDRSLRLRIPGRSVKMYVTGSRL